MFSDLLPGDKFDKISICFASSGPQFQSVINSGQMDVLVNLDSLIRILQLFAYFFPTFCYGREVRFASNVLQPFLKVLGGELLYLVMIRVICHQMFR